MIDLALVSWADLGWITVAFAMAMWLLTSALTGFEKAALGATARVLRAGLGLGVLLPNLAIAVPCLVAGAGAVALHRWRSNDPLSPQAEAQKNAPI